MPEDTKEVLLCLPGYNIRVAVNYRFPADHSIHSSGAICFAESSCSAMEIDHTLTVTDRFAFRMDGKGHAELGGRRGQGLGS